MSFLSFRIRKLRWNFPLPWARNFGIFSHSSSGINYHQILLMLINQGQVCHFLSINGAVTPVWIFKGLRLDFLSHLFSWSLQHQFLLDPFFKSLPEYSSMSVVFIMPLLCLNYGYLWWLIIIIFGWFRSQSCLLNDMPIWTVSDLISLMADDSIKDKVYSCLCCLLSRMWSLFFQMSKFYLFSSSFFLLFHDVPQRSWLPSWTIFLWYFL